MNTNVGHRLIIPIKKYTDLSLDTKMFIDFGIYKSDPIYKPLIRISVAPAIRRKLTASSYLSFGLNYEQAVWGFAKFRKDFYPYLLGSKIGFQQYF